MDGFFFGGQLRAQTYWRLVFRLGAVCLSWLVFDGGSRGCPGVVVEQVRFQLLFQLGLLSVHQPDMLLHVHSGVLLRYEPILMSFLLLGYGLLLSLSTFVLLS